MKKFRLHYWVRNNEDGSADVEFAESNEAARFKDNNQNIKWSSDSWCAENIYLDEQGKLYFKKPPLSIREDGKKIYLEEIKD